MSDQAGEQTAGASSLIGLFAPPHKEAEGLQSLKPRIPDPPNGKHERDDSENHTTSSNERTPLLEDQKASSSLQSLFDSSPAAKHDDKTPKTGSSRKFIPPQDRRDRMLSGAIPSMPAIHEVPIQGSKLSKPERPSFLTVDNIKSSLKCGAKELAEPASWIGGFMFLLFQVVFSLTFGATITRPHGTVSMLGLFTKMASLGIMFASPVYWLNLRDVPALYPTVDLFCAPFLANIAIIIDEVLYQDSAVSKSDNDQIFLATFTFLASTSLFISGTLLVLASVFKLANLGAFLPFPVLCGFFAAVGVLTWTLAFKVDTNGLTVSAVFLSGDPNLILNSLAHHAPSVAIAAIMKYLGPKNPLYVVMLVFSTIGLFYFIMFAFGISRDEMIERHWFWSTSDLHYEPMEKPVSGQSFSR